MRLRSLMTLAITLVTFGSFNSPLRASTQSVIIDERELLRRYLSEVSARSELEVETQLAKYDFQREVFREYSKRWWEQRKDEKDEELRDRLLNEYWNSYFEGQHYVSRLFETEAVGANRCKLLKAELPSASPSPGTLNSPSLLREAFQRGMVSRAPECFVTGLLDALKNIDRELVILKRGLFAYKKKVMSLRPTKDEMDRITELLEADLISLIDQTLSVSLVPVKESLGIPPTEKIEINRIANLLSLQMNCSTLHDRQGRKLNCNFMEIPSPVSFDKDALYKVFFLQQKLGVYRPTLSFKPLIDAARYFLSEVRPDDEFTLSLLLDLQFRLRSVDAMHGLQAESLLAQLKENYHRSIRSFQFNNRLSNLTQFTPQTRNALIQKFFDLRERIEGYLNLEAGTQTELDYIEGLASKYNAYLTEAASIHADIELESRPIFITLHDQDRTRIQIINTLPPLFVGHLLGRDSLETQAWVNYLLIR